MNGPEWPSLSPNHRENSPRTPPDSGDRSPLPVSTRECLDTKVGGAEDLTYFADAPETQPIVHSSRCS